MSLKEALGYLVQLRDLYRVHRATTRAEQQYRRLTREELQRERLVR
jgi:hypothetical protein